MTAAIYFSTLPRRIFWPPRLNFRPLWLIFRPGRDKIFWPPRLSFRPPRLIFWPPRLIFRPPRRILPCRDEFFYRCDFFFLTAATYFSTAATYFSTLPRLIFRSLRLIFRSYRDKIFWPTWLTFRPSRPRYGFSRVCLRLRTQFSLWIFGCGINISATDKVESCCSRTSTRVMPIFT